MWVLYTSKVYSTSTPLTSQKPFFHYTHADYEDTMPIPALILLFLSAMMHALLKAQKKNILRWAGK
jgi:hypothetical protein